MDTEADNTHVLINENSDLQLDMGKEDGTPEIGLSNMDRESTRKIRVKMGTALPKGPEVPSGDRYRQTGIDGSDTGQDVHDQNMDTNADDHRDMSERGEKKCSDTSDGLIPVEEEPRQVGRPNRESIVMDMEVDDTNMPKNEDSDLQPGMGREDEAPESGLSNMDRESTRTIGSEMGSALPKGLEVPSRDRYPQTGIDPMQGKKKGGQQYVVGDTNMTTDNAPSWHGNKPSPRIDSGDSEEGIEQQDGTEVGILQGNGVSTDETDKVHRESIRGSDTVRDPYQGPRNDMNPAKDEHLPQTNGSDIDQEDQDRDGKRQRGAIHWRGHDQNMNTNADDPRGMSERDEKKCSDTSEGLILAEEQWKVGRTNKETIAMDTEADNTHVPRNEDSDVQLDMGKEDGAPESGLSNMDRESTSKIGVEMGTTLPKGPDVPSGDRYLQTGIDLMQGEKMGGPPEAVGDTNTTTDKALKGHDNKLHPRSDSGDSERGIEHHNGMEEGILQGNEADTATRSRKRHNHNETSVKNLGDMEASDQLTYGIRTSDYASGVALHVQDETVMIEHLGEESEGRGHGTAMTTENSWQNTKDSPETITREQAVKEQEAGESETPLEEEREKNTGDGHTEPSSDEHRRKSNDVGQGAQPMAPVEIAKNIAERNYVSKTLALLSPPTYDKFTNIVSAYDVDITREDLARLQTGTKLNDGNIDWMMRWWAGQVNGRFGKKPSPPQSNSQLPRCYFASTYWYARMTSDGVFSHDNVKNWTAQFKILQQYDLMIIPIHVPARDHWILAVIDFEKKKTTIYDSIEKDITRSAHPEIHAYLMA